MELELLNEPITLLPQKAIWYKQRSTVLMADLHFGKITHFRKSGIAVPPRANEKNAELLIAVLQHTRAERLIFLGDLFHSHYNEEWEVLGQVRRHFVSCSFELVLGNHDILSALQYERNKMVVHLEKYQMGNFLFTHEPLATVPETVYNLSGHVHPAVQLRGPGKQSITLPCFYFGKRQGILPAFGSFTGTARIVPKKNDRIFVIADNKVIAYPHE
ncbi:MAG: ligase-associated DNA damage response endonuclease PdeM [Cyclobacteriaceae bacterium]|nr:ligase-associated DNA damage response endonuclease PdeM [Cytophagales bacterium]MBX2899966.1 ligase-associated DNA damage response endonuclease PdeM [Cyclobacteriaceae bacterium]